MKTLPKFEFLSVWSDKVFPFLHHRVRVSLIKINVPDRLPSDVKKVSVQFN